MAYVTVTTEVDVDIDLDEIETEVLEAELESRKADKIASCAGPEEVDFITERGTALYYALSFNNDSEALKIAKELAEEITGRII